MLSFMIWAQMCSTLLQDYKTCRKLHCSNANEQTTKKDEILQVVGDSTKDISVVSNIESNERIFIFRVVHIVFAMYYHLQILFVTYSFSAFAPLRIQSPRLL